MDWAHDQLGKAVHASDRQLFSYGFTCPTCGERVRRRAGTERRPHFAHYSNSAKPDCENYHPSTGEAIAIATRAWERAQRPTKLDALSLCGGVVLERGEGGRFSLFLKLPRLTPDIEVTGQLELRTGLGVRKYSAAQLRRPQFVPVLPKVPLVEAIGTEQLAAAAVAVANDISLFRQSGNVFRAGSETGQLLAPDEPLEWGETYRLFAQEVVLSSPAELQCVPVGAVGARGWYIYEIELPEYDGVNGAGRTAISHFFRRAIKQKSARAFLIDPLPHHFDPDGTCVFPALQGAFLIRTFGTCSLTIEGSACTSQTSLERDGDWTVLSGLRNGEFSVLVDGNPQIAGRTDECQLFLPFGIQVSVDGASMEMFDSRLRDILSVYGFARAVVECPSWRIADHIRLSKEEWDRKGTHFYCKAVDRDPEVDADNFGAIVRSQPKEIDGKASDSNDVDQKAAWLRDVLTRTVGARSALYLANPELLARDLPWLYPYVQAMTRVAQ